MNRLEGHVGEATMAILVATSELLALLLEVFTSLGAGVAVIANTRDVGGEVAAAISTRIIFRLLGVVLIFSGIIAVAAEAIDMVTFASTVIRAKLQGVEAISAILHVSLKRSLL